MTVHEDRLVNLEAEVNKLKGAYQHLATKADLAQLENRLTRWIAGGVFLTLVGMAVQELVN